MNRQELERAFWHGLKELHVDRTLGYRLVNTVDGWLNAADAYAERREHDRAVARLMAAQRDTPEQQEQRRAVLERNGA